MEKKKIAGCLFLDSGKILLVKRAVEQCWELPGGKVEEGEEPEVAALREAVEEINVKAEIIQQFDTYEFVKDDVRYENIVFEAVIKEGSPQANPSEGIAEVEWIPLEKLDQYTLSPNIELLKEDL